MAGPVNNLPRSSCYKSHVLLGKGILAMPFTAHALRYEPDKSFPALYAYLHQRAQRFLGSLRYDSDEVDLVVGHVIERLVCLGLIGGGDHAPATALDQLNDAQFYAFLNQCVKNKAIDRLRKRRLLVSSVAELDYAEETEGESDRDPLSEAVEPAWGPPPFATPEEVALHLTSQQELRNLLKHCIKALSGAPRQFQAVLQELEEMGATELLQDVLTEIQANMPPLDAPLAHSSQHKDHAHKKLRPCLQAHSTNLAVIVALRLTEYVADATNRGEVPIQALAQETLSIHDVQQGLRQLVTEGLLAWNGGETIHLTAAQVKHLSRFYKEE